MLTYQELLDNIKDGKQLYDIRLQLMKDIENHTGRKLIVYATDAKKGMSTIEPDDIVGFSDLIKGLEGQPLDIFINSPGGSAEATEQIVNFLRSNFRDIRFIVPNIAMSAATLMCLSGNEVLMDDRSSLGPIDPQIRIPTPSGPSWFPAQMIIDGFQKAQEEIKNDQRALPIFLPWLTYFVPYIQICQNAISLSKELATRWLTAYMFLDHEGAEKISAYLSDHNLHKSHGRQIRIEDAIREGLKIKDMRVYNKLRELVWQLWCNIYFLFDKTMKAKIFENAYGINWGRDVAPQQVSIQLPIPGVPIPPQVPAQPSST